MYEGQLPKGFRLLGPSTRPTTLTTGETIEFTREGLEGTVARAKTRFIPQPVEHLHYLPPIGRVAELILVDIDGDAFLAGREQPLSPAKAGDLVLPVAPHGEDDGDGDGKVPGLTVTLGTEPRNFDEADLAEIRAEAPVEVGEIALRADLPPIIWSFILTGGATTGLYAGKVFLKEFLSKVGAASGDSFVMWLSSAARRARRADRDQMVEFRFELESGLAVLAFCPFSPESQVSVTEFRKSLERLGDVAMFAGHSDDGGVPDEMRQAAFIWSSTDGWRLAWWASEESVFTTDWFRRHAPAPERFLGYTPPTLRLLEPYMPELPGAAPPVAPSLHDASAGGTVWTDDVGALSGDRHGD